MAVSKKYAGLPDLDAAPEVYETPDLADDVSTVQTGTVRTISPSPSEDADSPGLDRAPLDRSSARRRFEPSTVDAKDVNFSDSIGGTRRSYRTRSSRRRRRRQENGVEELGDLSDSEEEETVQRKLARLKREAEELRLELLRRDQERDRDGEPEFEDSLEQQQQESEVEVVDGVEELSRVLDGLSAQARSKTAGTVEDELLSSLDSASRQRRRQWERTKPPDSRQEDTPAGPPPSTISDVAGFSDRLTALESALGVSSLNMGTSSHPPSILPTLDSLSGKITALSSTLNPKALNSSPNSSTTPFLDTIIAKLRILTAESDRLTTSRKAALASLTDLHEKRMQQLVSATVHGNTRPRRGMSNTSTVNNQTPAAAEPAGPGEESLALQSQLFLDEQSSKITALYQLLPSIQDLQPLLPVVLERLRALSVIHAGAAQAQQTLEELEQRQAEMKREIGEWRTAVEGVEQGIKEMEEVVRGNVQVLGEGVRGLEERVGKLEGR